MKSNMFNANNIRTVLNTAIVFILMLVPVNKARGLLFSCRLPGYKKMNQEKEWKLIDKGVGINDDLVSFCNFCRENIPVHTNVIFFMPYAYYRARYNTDYYFAYIPYRLRYYCYPIKVWWFRDKYKVLAKLWLHVEPDSKRKLLEKANFIVGISIDAKEFPGFFEYKRNDSGGVILKRQ